MDGLTTLISQLKTLWSRWDASQRVIISGAALLCAVTVIGTMYWATRPDFVVLADKLTPQRSAEIIGLLENQQIDSESNYSSSSVSVARSYVGRVRLALRDVIAPSEQAPDSGSSPFPPSPEEAAGQRQRNKEHRLAQVIKSIQGINEVHVVISQPDPSPFAIQQTPPSASVMIDPAPGIPFTMSTARSIVDLVAKGVEGLSPEQISLVDTQGRTLTGGSAGDTAMSSQLDYKRQVEADRAGKAERLLTQMLGPGRATVQVNADIAFDELERTETTYDPDSKATLEESIQTESTTNNANAGLAGVDANVTPELLGTAGVSNETSKSEISTFKYQTGKVEQKTIEHPGTVTRLTVSALVDLIGPPSADEAATTPPPAPTRTKDDVEKMVKSAVGFDALRGDEISVVIASMPPLEPIFAAPGPLAWWDTYGPLIQWGILGASVTAILIVGLLVLKRMAPVSMPTATESSLSLEEMRRLMALSDQARQNPDLVANILNTWLDTESSDDAEQPSGQPQPAARRRAA